MSIRNELRHCSAKPRVFIISDISNEPDDAESLVRYLLYSNEFETRGLVACTSTWMKNVVHPEDMQKIIHAYREVVDDLNAHVHPNNPYPSAKELLDLVSTGPALYGLQALASGVPLSPGAQMLIDRLDESDDPLWLLCWGGTNVLAQALQTAQNGRAQVDFARLKSKLRVYAISDQDDTGPWIRSNHPDIFYISSIHGWNQHGLAAWTGISGDHYYKFDQGGPDATKISKDWIRQHIQIGPLGKAYPNYIFIPEVDTPTFLYLIQNGLGSPENPNWGSWGGRYSLADLSLGAKHYADVADRVEGKNEQLYISNHATIWRWRNAFQNDFAARIQWTLGKDLSKANHAPVVIVNNSTAGGEPLYLEAEADSEIELDASKSYDPDGHDISFRWFHYKDVTATQWWVDAEVATVEFTELDEELSGRVVLARMPNAERCAIDMISGKAQKTGQILHLILEVKDNGAPSMTTYKRIVVQITNPRLEGGRASTVESMAGVSF